MFRGARTFVARAIDGLIDELNRYSRDVHDAFRSVDERYAAAAARIAALEPALSQLETDMAAAQASISSINASIVSINASIAAAHPAGFATNSSGSISGPTPLEFTAPTVTPQRTGLFLIIVTATTDLSGTLFSLRVDGATVARTILLGSGSSVTGTVSAIVQVDPDTTHTFGVRVSGSGSGTIPIDGALVTWVEL